MKNIKVLHSKGQVNFILQQASKAQRGSKLQFYSFLNIGSRCGWVGGQCHNLAALPPGKTRYPLYRRLGGPQGWPGWVVHSTQQYYSDQIKDDMGTKCSIYERRSLYRIWSGNQAIAAESIYNIDRRDNCLKFILKIGHDTVDRNQLAEETVKFWSLVYSGTF